MEVGACKADPIVTPAAGRFVWQSGRKRKSPHNNTSHCSELYVLHSQVEVRASGEKSSPSLPFFLQISPSDLSDVIGAGARYRLHLQPLPPDTNLIGERSEGVEKGSQHFQQSTLLDPRIHRVDDTIPTM